MRIEYYLFRVKLEKTLSLFPQNRLPTTSSNITQEKIAPTRRQILLEAIKEKPSLQLGNDYIWHLGNVETIDENGGYFAVGRTKDDILEQYDLRNKDFIDSTYEVSPYTHVVYDLHIQLLAIARRNKLLPNIEGISKKLRLLLTGTTPVISNDMILKIDPIPDPKNFIDSLLSAYAIKEYTAEFGMPNPFDAEEYLQKPMSIYLAAAEGNNGKTTIKGHKLNAEVLVDVTKSVAATGNEAEAQIQSSPDEKEIRKRLNGKHIAKFSVKEHNKKNVLDKARLIYREIRGNIN